MTPQEFKAVLRPWLDREPFVPFAFELDSGERREVYSREAISYPDGSAAFLHDQTVDEAVLDDLVRCESVRRIVPLPLREIQVMTPEVFETELRRLRWQEPFRPFVIELLSGERVEVDDGNGLSFAGGYGTFITAKGEPIEFAHNDVRRIIAPESMTPA
jgi:hypothetical protein